MASGYPDSVSWESGCLRVGEGEFSPVSQAVWEFSVSDFYVVDNWIKSRLSDRTGRRGSPLDEIRPVTWTAGMTQELLELLWVLEATIVEQQAMDALLSDIVVGPVFLASELPLPTVAEREPPPCDGDGDGQHELALDEPPPLT
jgi:hypothetical protein